MTITNGEEIKIQIRKMGLTQKEFAQQADIDYHYLNKVLNGTHIYTDVLDAFKKLGIRYDRKVRTKKKALRKVA